MHCCSCLTWLQALAEIRNTRMLTATAEKGIEDALSDLNKVLQAQGGSLTAVSATGATAQQGQEASAEQQAARVQA